jgi:hypothetical protein
VTAHQVISALVNLSGNDDEPLKVYNIDTGIEMDIESVEHDDGLVIKVKQLKHRRPGYVLACGSGAGDCALPFGGSTPLGDLPGDYHDHPLGRSGANR